MKKTKIYFFTILFIFIGLVVLSFSMNRNVNLNQGLSEESQVLYGFIDREAKKLGAKYGMEHCGTGGGGRDGIWLMSLSFQRFGSHLNEEDARKLIINCSNDFIESINNDETIRPFLKIYPFSAKNIDLTIYNYQENGRWIYYPDIFIENNAEGKIAFYTKDESEKYGYKTEKYETYEEAVAILKKEKEQKSSSTQ